MNIIFLNKNLDKCQKKAVLCNKPAYLVVAGAGSGKTLTISSKVGYLLNNNYKNSEILCISFTNETVNSLKERLNQNNTLVDVLTFHKLALYIIGREYKIASSNTLEYVTCEYLNSIIYHDNTYKLLEFIDNKTYLKEIIISFINQLKSFNYDYLYIYKLIKSNISSDNKILLIIILKVYLIYQEELKSENKIDFNDMINLAINKIDRLNRFKYSYIIIDEYQDTSFTKYLLIKKLVDKFNIKIMAVGDDYQSIYSFNGCDIKLFTKFKKYFKHSKIIKLKNNYRNSSDIVEISRRFVLKNKGQINKRIKSNKYIKDSITIVYINDEEKSFIKVISNLDNIMVLARNNKDLEKVKNIDVDKNITYLTVHASKGLEEENVIILNVIDDYLGFPNKINNNEVLFYIHKYNSLEEERRLFYVALTRAKKRVFIFTKRDKESVFIKELLKAFRYKIKILDLDKKTLNN